MLRLLLLLGILARVSHAYTVSGFQPVVQTNFLRVQDGGGVKYRYQLVKSQPYIGDARGDAWYTFRDSATYAKNSTGGNPGHHLHMYELINGKYHLKSISDVSGPSYRYNGIIPGSDKLDPNVVLLEEEGGVVVLRRNSQGYYVIEGSLGSAAVPIFQVSEDTTWRLTTSGEDITYLYVDAGLEYELKKEAGVWSWGFSSRSNPPLANPRSFLLNDNEFIYVSEEHTPLVIKIFSFNGTTWNTVLDYEEYVYSPPPTFISQVSTCTLVEVQEGEVLMTSSLVKWGNASGIFNTDMSDYTIEKTNGSWGVTKEVTFDRIDNYTSPSSGAFSACSVTVSYILTDESRIFYEIPFAQALLGFDDPVQLYRRLPNGTKDVLLQSPVTLDTALGGTIVMENLDKFVIFDSDRSAADVYDLSNGGFALEDTLNFTLNGTAIDTFVVSLSAIANSLVMSFDSQFFTIGGFN